MELQRDEHGRPEIRERGKGTDGNPRFSERRLYLQFLAFSGCAEPRLLTAALGAAGVKGALYADLNHPTGVGLAVAHERPDYFVTEYRGLLNEPPFRELTLRPEFTMFGRSYSIGHETDLERALIGRPLERLLNPELGWVVWYPLRRAGSFEQLPDKEKREILMEHGMIGSAFGEANLAHDIRLACFGLDTHDNDFVIGLLGHDLHPLSTVVETMRKTKQTSQHIERLGPFFVGRVIWQAKG